MIDKESITAREKRVRREERGASDRTERERQYLEKRQAADSISLSVWGRGPSEHPFENSFKQINVERDERNKILTIYFERNEKCVIFNPVGVSWDGKLPTVESADKIILEQYAHGLAPSEDTRIVREYVYIDRAHVRYTLKSKSENIDEIINAFGVAAVYSVPGY